MFRLCYTVQMRHQCIWSQNKITQFMYAQSLTKMQVTSPDTDYRCRLFWLICKQKRWLTVCKNNLIITHYSLWCNCVWPQIHMIFFNFVELCSRFCKWFNRKSLQYLGISKEYRPYSLWSLYRFSDKPSTFQQNYFPSFSSYDWLCISN